MKQVPARLEYSVDVECPNCDKIIHLLDEYNDDSAITIPLFNNKWDDVKGVAVHCDGCGEDFELSTIEY